MEKFNGVEYDGVNIQKPQKSRWYLLTIVLLSVLLAFAVAGLIVFAALYGTSSSDDSDSSVCQSDACFDLSVQIKGAMDESVDPCEDFYNFTCGNWDIYNGIQPGFARYTTILVQQDLVYEELADVLETDFAGGKSVFMELKDLYDSCILAQVSDDVDLGPVLDLYQELGGWSVINVPGDGTEWGLNSIQFIREKRLGSAAFYSLQIGVNDAVTEFTLEIEQSGLTLESPLSYNYPDARRGGEELIVTVLAELLGMNTTEIQQVAADIIEFESKLAQIWVDTVMEDHSMNSTIYSLYQLWPEHDWLTVLRDIFAPSGVRISPSSIVTVVTPDYFRNLNSVIRNTSINVLENYAKWQTTLTIKMALSVDNTIRETMNQFKETFLAKPSMEQRQECVSYVESAMGFLLGRIYAEHILPSGSKEAGVELVTEVMKGLRQRIMEVDWLDDETRQLSIEKLDAIESRVAYPDFTFDDDSLERIYGEYDFSETAFIENAIEILKSSTTGYYSLLYRSVSRDIWLRRPTSVNAYYVPAFNQITILEGIMSAPIFNKDWPLAMQYGGLGMVIGHEFTHGFDNNGRRYDKYGRKRMWWTEEAVQAFKDRSQCFVEQYSNYEMFGISLDGNITLGENIADNGGVKASYSAYKKVSHKDQQLPGLTDFSNDQLFFIAFGQLWCSNINENVFAALVDRVHSPPPYRVLGSLMNNEDFAKAFSCPAGSPMNPQDKCVLW